MTLPTPKTPEMAAERTRYAARMVELRSQLQSVRVARRAGAPVADDADLAIIAAIDAEEANHKATMKRLEAAAKEALEQQQAAKRIAHNSVFCWEHVPGGLSPPPGYEWVDDVLDYLLPARWRAELNWEPVRCAVTIQGQGKSEWFSAFSRRCDPTRSQHEWEGSLTESVNDAIRRILRPAESAAA